MPFDSTPGSTTQNSYVSVADADAYFAYHDDAASWPSVNGDKEKALVSATRELDALSFRGRRVTDTQALEFPRYEVSRRSGLSFYDSTEIPVELKNAVCERALQRARTDPASVVSEELAQFKKLKLPGIELEMRDSAPSESGLGPAVLKPIAHLLRAGTNFVRLIRA